MFYNEEELKNIERKKKAILEMKKTPMNYKEELERHTKMQEIAREMEKEMESENDNTDYNINNPIAKSGEIDHPNPI